MKRCVNPHCLDPLPAETADELCVSCRYMRRRGTFWGGFVMGAAMVALRIIWKVIQ